MQLELKACLPRDSVAKDDFPDSLTPEAVGIRWLNQPELMDAFPNPM